MGWRYDLGKLEPYQRAIVMKGDEEEKLRREEESRRKKSFTKADEKDFSPIFSLSYAGTSAKAQEIKGNFTVLKGSFARKTQADNLAKSIIQIRENLVQDEILLNSQNQDFWFFSQNVAFHNSSIAAKVGCGASINGKKYWKIEETIQ